MWRIGGRRKEFGPLFGPNSVPIRSQFGPKWFFRKWRSFEACFCRGCFDISVHYSVPPLCFSVHLPFPTKANAIPTFWKFAKFKRIWGRPRKSNLLKTSGSAQKAAEVAAAPPKVEAEVPRFLFIFNRALILIWNVAGPLGFHFPYLLFFEK